LRASFVSAKANENGSRPLWVIRASHDLVSDRIASLKSDRERAKVALERARPHPPSNFFHSAVDIERFGILMSEKFTNGDISFRRINLRSIIDGVEVWDKLIRIHGSKSSLEQANPL
jgi:hypothetical protein